MNFIPLARSRSLKEFQAYCASDAARSAWEFDEALIAEHGQKVEWTFRGYSDPACEIVEFEVDQLVGGTFDGSINRPNLHERLVCPVTRLNNRQRLTAIDLA